MNNILEILVRKLTKNKSIDQRPVGLLWHESFIEHLASVIRPRTYVELGLYQCALFNRIIPYAEKLIGVDINPSAGNYMASTRKAEFICASTQEFAHEIQENPFPIDMVFIDADHSKVAVLTDFGNMFPSITLHGIILLHDTHPGDKSLIDPKFCGTAYAAISELSKENAEYEMVTIPVSPGLQFAGSA
jgi:predicted O-methyltransferase YrrM